MKRFTRLSLGFSKKVENLRGRPLHVAHNNLGRIHSNLKMPPARAAGVVDELWTIEDLYVAVMG
jgi:hypothetical protein